MMDKDVNWLGLDLKSFAAKIMEKGEPDPAVAEELAMDLSELDASLQEDFKRFWKTGVATSSVEIEGYSVGYFIEKGKEPLAAFMSMDELIKEPEETLAFLKE